MSSPELRASWATSLRHLAASRFYLPQDLPSAEAAQSWSEAEDYLHHNELGLALDYLVGLGEACSAPPEFWQELLLAASNMGAGEVADAIRAKL
jgi:hypothetical protein